MTDTTIADTPSAPAEQSFDDRADSILGKLDAEEAQPAEARQQDDQSSTAHEEPESEEDAPETRSEEQVQPAKTYKVKVDGQELEVPEDELLKGYSRQQDYSRKTAEVAEQRKAVESQRQAIEAERQKYAQGLDYFLQQVQAGDQILSEGQRTDWAKLAQDNPAEYVAKKAAYEQRVQTVQQAVAERQQLAEQERVQRLQRADQHLTDAIPEWKDEGKRTAIQKDVADVLMRSGYSREELGHLSDPRAVVIARKAAEYDRMMAAQKTVETKKITPPAPKVTRPGAAPEAKPDETARAAALTRRANQTGKFDDRLAAVMAKL